MIETDLDGCPCYLNTNGETETKLLELFDDNQRIRTLRRGCCSYFVVLDNNKLLDIDFNNYSDKPTRYIFTLYEDADKCFAVHDVNPGAHSNHMLVMDSKGHEINQIDYENLKGGASLDFDMSSAFQTYLIDIIEPTSIEQIKERAKKGRTK